MRLFRKYVLPSHNEKSAGKKKKEKRFRASSLFNSNSSRATSRTSPLSSYSSSSSDPTKRLSADVLARIFYYVCPHTLDESYNSSEESITEDGCMLCDMRDLACCALVNKKWCKSAQKLLYQHVRIDAVHYCELEIELSSKRKRSRSFVDQAGKKLDVPQSRLYQFMRTVRDSQQLANTVLSLRLPYMTREASKSDLARAISVLRNLRYVDLPVGFFTDDPSSYALKQELMANCPDVRRMTYAHGSEMSFSKIPGSSLWRNLESLELSNLQVEESTLRQVLSSFPALRCLKLESMPSIRDSVFTPNQYLPMFPPIAKLTIRNMLSITASGLATHLSVPQNQKALEELALVQCGVRPESLYMIFSRAPRLANLTLELEVDSSFLTQEVPPLASRSLKTLHYEITCSGSPTGLQPVTKSHYDYLMSSLKANNLPSLRSLYVLDSSFADILLLAPPPRLFGGGEGGSQSLGPGLQHPLTLYTKGMDEFEWNVTQFEPMSSGRRTSTTRPVSLHSAQLSPQWGGEARQSVLVGNGFGGYLAVPVNEGRPMSSGGIRGNKRDSKYDLWR
ncbi:F-box domain protein [Talaromyces stipitatus ATCC 10500]|uniref:F-box domain protein n=1 Tax=Talaromyces stipitatus (strain ATCC 10500 / CBS 375.48 / QM 6759 / NRRL 1006) TaxID=441959 RepID=B8MAT5_TALSN|nr:F-box domain protein [Talaromyces stipitatus ATCC 10500]EED17775.1 F-box domain protein [Talaromyces stipitatus ATCC 10500]